MTHQRQHHLLGASFGLALVLLGLLGVGVFQQIRGNREAREMVTHTQEVARQLTLVFSQIQDLWGAPRGFVLTGQEASLAAYHAAVESLPASSARLRNLTADNPAETRRVDQLETLIRRRVEFSERIIAARREGGQAEAEALIASGEGQRLMDTTRALLVAMGAVESRLLLERSAALQATEARTLAFSLLLVAGIGVLLGVIALLFRRSLTARQEAHELTEKARAHAASIVDTVREPLLVLDQTQRVVSANRAFYLAFGGTAAATEGRLLYELGAGEWNLPRLREALAEVTAGHTTVEGLRVDTDFGSLGHRTLLLNARKTFRVGNHSSTILLAIEDLTGRREAEEDRDSLFTLSQDLVAVAGFDGCFKRLNPAWERTLGHPPGDLVGAPFLSFVHPDDREATQAQANRLTQAHDAVSFENRYRCRDGSYRWLRWNATPSVEQQLIYAIVRDITEWKTHEERLHQTHRDLEVRFAMALRASGQLLYEWNLETDSLHHENPEALGIARTELDGDRARWLRLVHADDRGNYDAAVTTALQSRAPLAVEYRLLQADGSYRQVEDRGYPVAASAGQPTRMIGFISDISVRRLLEAQLHHSAKMDAVGRLAGGIAHDFNNLLGVIIGFSDLLVEQLAANPETLGYVTEIRKAGSHAATLTRQLLAFSRKQVLAPQLLNLNDIVFDQQRLLDRLIGADVTLVTRPSVNLGAVRADPGQVEQVVLNLAVNAREAMPQGGTLTIATANVEIGGGTGVEGPALAPGRYVMLSVSDTGIGMDAATRTRLFEPFFTTKANGTGLGLATSFGIVRQSGGDIQVESTPGKGSTFRVYFPIAPEGAGQPQQVRVATAPAGGSETILLVEDSAALRSAARRILEMAGYRVMEAADGEAALALVDANAGTVDLLVTDIVMPGMGGPKLVAALRQRNPGLRVMYMSGYTDDTVIRHGVMDATIPLLQKPFERDELLGTVRQMLDRWGPA